LPLDFDLEILLNMTRVGNGKRLSVVEATIRALLMKKGPDLTDRLRQESISTLAYTIYKIKFMDNIIMDELNRQLAEELQEAFCVNFQYVNYGDNNN
jgi:hypothetical protein